MKKIFFLILFPILILLVFSGCSSNQHIFNYSSKNIDKLVYNFDANKAAPREYIDITEKGDIDRILALFKGIVYEKADEPLTVGIPPITGYLKDTLIFSCFNDGSFLAIGKIEYKASPGQESKLKNAEENMVEIIKELKGSGKYQSYTQ